MPKLSSESKGFLDVVIRTAYDGVRSSPQVRCTEDLTRQSDAGECDIRTIMKRYEQTGVIPVGRDVSQARFVDNDSAPNYEETARSVAGMRGWFSELPVELRQRFGSVDGVLDALDFAQGDTPEARAMRAELDRLGISEPAPDLTPSEGRDTNARHSAGLDKAVPTDGELNDEAETDGQGRKPKGVQAKRAAGTPAE